MQVQCFRVSLGKIKPAVMCHLARDHHSLVPDIRVRNQDPCSRPRWRRVFLPDQLRRAASSQPDVGCINGERVVERAEFFGFNQIQD